MREQYSIALLQSLPLFLMSPPPPIFGLEIRLFLHNIKLAVPSEDWQALPRFLKDGGMTFFFLRFNKPLILQLQNSLLHALPNNILSTCDVDNKEIMFWSSLRPLPCPPPSENWLFPMLCSCSVSLIAVISFVLRTLGLRSQVHSEIDKRMLSQCDTAAAGSQEKQVQRLPGESVALAHSWERKYPRVLFPFPAPVFAFLLVLFSLFSLLEGCGKTHESTGPLKEGHLWINHSVCLTLYALLIFQVV